MEDQDEIDHSMIRKRSVEFLGGGNTICLESGGKTAVAMIVKHTEIDTSLVGSLFADAGEGVVVLDCQ